MEPLKLPRELDQPQTLFFWSVDEIVIFSIVFAFGVLTDHIVIYSAIGIGISSIFRRFRESKADGYLLHLMYWWGLAPMKGSTIVNPFERRVLPS